MDLALIGGKIFLRDRRGQIDVRRNNVGSAQESVQPLNLRCLCRGRDEDGDGETAFGNDRPSQSRR